MARFTLFAWLLSAAAASAQNNFVYVPSSTKPVSAFWTATARLADFYSLDAYTYPDGSITTDSVLQTRTIKSNVTPTAVPTYSSTHKARYDSDVEQVFFYYPTGVVAESDLVPNESRATGSALFTTTDYDYSMAIIMTAPSTCSSKFTVTSVASVYVPSEAISLVKPTSTQTGSSETDRFGYVTISVTYYLSDGSAPYATSLDSNYKYYVQSCRTPPLAYRNASPTGSSRYGSDGDTGDDDEGPYCYWTNGRCGISLLIIIIIIVASVVGGLFFLGFLESWLWFRRLMLGKSAVRCGTICWILISLWVLCFTRMQDRRSTEDQKLLAARWKEMKAGAKFKAWMKYGLRHRYPEEYLGQFSKMTVGIVPPGAPLHPQMPTGILPGGQFIYSNPQSVPAPYIPGNPPQNSTAPPGELAGFYGAEMTKGGGAVAGNSPLPTQAPTSSSSPPAVHTHDVPQPTTTEMSEAPATAAPPAPRN